LFPFFIDYTFLNYREVTIKAITLFTALPKDEKKEKKKPAETVFYSISTGFIFL